MTSVATTKLTPPWRSPRAGSEDRNERNAVTVRAEQRWWRSLFAAAGDRNWHNFQIALKAYGRSSPVPKKKEGSRRPHRAIPGVASAWRSLDRGSCGSQLHLLYQKTRLRPLALADYSGRSPQLVDHRCGRGDELGGARAERGSQHEHPTAADHPSDRVALAARGGRGSQPLYPRTSGSAWCPSGGCRPRRPRIATVTTTFGAPRPPPLAAAVRDGRGIATAYPAPLPSRLRCRVGHPSGCPTGSQHRRPVRGSVPGLHPSGHCWWWPRIATSWEWGAHSSSRSFSGRRSRRPGIATISSG